MSVNPILWLKSSVREDDIRAILTDKGWRIEVEQLRSRFNDRTLTFCKNDIQITYVGVAEFAVHSLQLNVKTPYLQDDLSIIAAELSSYFETWDLTELYQDLDSKDLLKRIEALRILVIKSSLEKVLDFQMFSALTEAVIHKNKIIRLAATFLCGLLTDSYRDEIRKITEGQCIADPELAENWKQIAEKLLFNRNHDLMIFPYNP